jgi:hypothetical protein
MKIHVGAYAASAGLEEAAEAALYEGLAGLDIAGLEQPFFGTLHRRDEGWLIGQIRPEWSLVLTTLPGTMDRLAGDRRFGLASADADARSRAVDFIETARRAVEKLNRALGRRAVRAVMVHSAPRLDGARAKRSLDGFAEALTDLRARDWQGATLLVEHCDAAVPGLAPDKGFLRIEDDVLAARLSEGPTPVGVAINWGRSAVETRSPDGPLEHIARAVQADLLGALFFSGAVPDHPDYGAWRDSHAPFSTTCPESLMTPAAARAALAEARDCPILGLKLQTKPATLSVPQRLSVIQDGLNALR